MARHAPKTDAMRMAAALGFIDIAEPKPENNSSGPDALYEALIHGWCGGLKTTDKKRLRVLINKHMPSSVNEPAYMQELGKLRRASLDNKSQLQKLTAQLQLALNERDDARNLADVLQERIQELQLKLDGQEKLAQIFKGQWQDAMKMSDRLLHIIRLVRDVTDFKLTS